MTRVSSACLPLCLCACLLSGCNSQDSADKTSGTSPISHSQGRDLEAVYLIGPAAAREIGYRIDWEADVQPIQASGLRGVTPKDDAVFVLDGKNYFTRLRRTDGRRLWWVRSPRARGTWSWRRTWAESASWRSWGTTPCRGSAEAEVT